MGSKLCGKFLKKHAPEMLRSIIVPFGTVLIMTPVGLCLLAPLGSILGLYLSNAFIWVYETFGFLGVALFTALHPLMVMTGMHTGIGPYLVQSLTDPGYEGLASPATFIDNINIGMAALAVGIKSKITRVKSNAVSSGITAVVGGITEPALFGTVLQFRPVLISTMIGGFVGGAIAGLAKCVCYAFAGSYGVLGLVTFIGDKGMMNLYMMIVAVVAGAVTTFVLTMILYKDKPQEFVDQIDGETGSEEAFVAENEIAAPISGEVKALSECSDAVFGSGTLGQGIIIEPAEGKVFAPCDGQVSSLFDTLHAIGIQADNGAEVLIHVGMDTVTLNGEGFKAHVKTGDKVKAGQLLLEFDIELIRSKGLMVTTPVVIANYDQYPDMACQLGSKSHGDTIIIL